MDCKMSILHMSLLPIYSPDISGSQDGSVRMWEFGHAQEITSHHTSGSYQRVTRARFSPHGNKVGHRALF